MCCLPWVSEELLPPFEEFKYQGVLFTSDQKKEQEEDRAELQGELQGEALDLLVCLCSALHLWSRALGSDGRDKAANTSG